MRLQVLCATMNQKDFADFFKMNIQSDIIYANQADYTGYDAEIIEEHNAQMITTQTRGVSKNRNIGIIYSDADIILFSDDDIKYNDEYCENILNAFKKLPRADALIFNIDTKKSGMLTDAGRRKNNTVKRVRFLDCMNYGTCRLAVRRRCIRSKNISFNDCFGGGNIYSNGEDVLFICDLLKRGLKVYTYPYTIGTVTQDTSTWFNGYNEKFLYDKGALFAAVSKIFAKLLCVQLILRHREMYKDAGLTFYRAYELMKKGIKGYNNLVSYDEAVRRGTV